MKALRDAFGDEILALGRENPNVYVVDCDIGKSCKTLEFARQLPQQHLNVGIAEQNAAGVSAGLATCGKIPFVSTYINPPQFPEWPAGIPARWGPDRARQLRSP